MGKRGKGKGKGKGKGERELESKQRVEERTKRIKSINTEACDT
jgi:hypothetical protein